MLYITYLKPFNVLTKIMECTRSPGKANILIIDGDGKVLILAHFRSYKNNVVHLPKARHAKHALKGGGQYTNTCI